jgi:hypothetical protein
MTHDFARFGNIVKEACQVREDIARVLAQAFYATPDKHSLLNIGHVRRV